MRPAMARPPSRPAATSERAEPRPAAPPRVPLPPRRSATRAQHRAPHRLERQHRPPPPPPPPLPQRPPPSFQQRPQPLQRQRPVRPPQRTERRAPPDRRAQPLPRQQPPVRPPPVRPPTPPAAANWRWQPGRDQPFQERRRRKREAKLGQAGGRHADRVVAASARSSSASWSA